MIDEAIRFSAQVFKIQTLVDGGLRLTLDLVQPIDDSAVMDLIRSKQPGITLECAAVIVKQRSNNAISARSEWQS